MAYEMSFLEKERVVEIVYGKTMNNEELHTAFAESARLGKENNTLLFLVDCTHLEGGHSVFDLVDIIALFDTLQLGHSMKEAIIFKPGIPNTTNVNFFETAARNKGYMVSIFTTREAALAWLLL